VRRKTWASQHAQALGYSTGRAAERTGHLAFFVADTFALRQGTGEGDS
jgi:hypothetical protein